MHHTHPASYVQHGSNDYLEENLYHSQNNHKQFTKYQVMYNKRTLSREHIYFAVQKYLSKCNHVVDLTGLQ